MKNIRITDIIFFTILFGMLIIVFTFVILKSLYGIEIPVFITNFWWVLLMPVVILKVFFPKSKVTNWLEKERDLTRKKI